MHVEYIVKPIYFASLKFSGIFLVLKAYIVQSGTRKIMRMSEIMRL